MANQAGRDFCATIGHPPMLDRDWTGIVPCLCGDKSYRKLSPAERAELFADEATRRQSDLGELE